MSKTQRQNFGNSLRSLLLIALVTGAVGCRSGYDLSSSRGQMEWGVDAATMELWREARFRFERAIEIDPGDAKSWSNLAVAYEGTGEVDLARQAYLRALQIDRSNEHIQRNYSRFLEHHDRDDGKGDPKEDSETDGAEESSDSGAAQ